MTICYRSSESTLIYRSIDIQRIGRTILDSCANALPYFRGQRLHRQNAQHGVSPIEGSLRAAHHIHAADVQKTEVEMIFVDYRHIIYIETHDWVFHPGADTSYIYGRGHG